jgi:hypothetical protein
MMLPMRHLRPREKAAGSEYWLETPANYRFGKYKLERKRVGVMYLRCVYSAEQTDMVEDRRIGNSVSHTFSGVLTPSIEIACVFEIACPSK